MSKVLDWILNLWDNIMNMLFFLVAGVMSILPDSPIQSAEIFLESAALPNIMGHINYFVPVGIMLGILTTYLISVGVWYIVRWAMRIGKYIQ